MWIKYRIDSNSRKNNRNTKLRLIYDYTITMPSLSRANISGDKQHRSCFKTKENKMASESTIFTMMGDSYITLPTKVRTTSKTWPKKATTRIKRVMNDRNTVASRREHPEECDCGNTNSDWSMTTKEKLKAKIDHYLTRWSIRAKFHRESVVSIVRLLASLH